MKSRRLSWIAMLVALSAVGASLKIPAPIGSVALDSFPALLAAGLFGGPAGAAAGSLGHLLSALIGGLPLGPFHVLIAGEMALLAYVFALLYKNDKRLSAGMLFVIGNSFVAPLPFIFIMGMPFYIAIVPSLFTGSVLNTVLAFLVLPRIARVFERSPLFSRET
ncbi:ECF transporter S component [Mesobacillus subterraneus]|uniref:ECF transporter S component n=1 Tax=Mesobacillus subterraneus TaxID=285983 RepID=A0A427TWX9_9BACI|nr:ECF transporter S component [Mesobacillus subterraneus]RSD28951.1 ECF transporter S component [Mesobacillus subterraneus]